MVNKGKKDSDTFSRRFTVVFCPLCKEERFTLNLTVYKHPAKKTIWEHMWRHHADKMWKSHGTMRPEVIIPTDKELRAVNWNSQQEIKKFIRRYVGVRKHYFKLVKRTLKTVQQPELMDSTRKIS